MRVRLVGPDDVLPQGVQIVYLWAMPRIGDMLTVGDILPGIIFRVADVCINTVAGENGQIPIPDVAVKVEG